MSRKPELLPVPDGCKMKLYHFHKPEDIADAISIAIEEDFPKRKKSPRYLSLAFLLKEGEPEAVGFGWAICSHKDSPSRKLGRIIAHNRAIHDYNYWSAGGQG